MSLIEKMSILGIRSFGPDDQDKQVIQFFNPLTLILGPNGTGKTTIIECLRYITTGDPPPGSRGGAFIHDPKIAHEQRVKAEVRLMFRDILGKETIVQRSIEATQKAKKIEVRSLDGIITRRGPDGQKQSITSRCAEIDQDMITALGVSKPVLENVIFCHQEEANWPLSEGKALKDKFDAIFASTRYVKASESIRKLKVAQDHQIKEYKAEIKYLKQNKESAARIECDLTETETKYVASKESVQKVKQEIIPLEDKLDKIYTRAVDINQLNSRIGKMIGEKEMLEKTVKELEENIENKFVGSDSELKDCIDDFQQKVREREDTVKQFETKKTNLQRKLDKLNPEKSSVDMDVGKREQEFEVNEENVRRRDALLRQMANEHDIPGYTSGEINTERVGSFGRHVDGLVADLSIKIKDIKREYEGKEGGIQKSIDGVREKKTRLEQNKYNKQNTMTKNKNEVREINQKLSKVAASGERRQQVERDSKQVENELQTIQSSVDVNQLKVDIESLKSEKKTLDAQLSSLNTEMSRLHMQSGIQTELNLLKKQKTEKEDAVRRIKARHEDSLQHLLGEIPSENIRGVLDEHLIKLTDEVKRSEKSLQSQQMELSRYEANRKMLMEQLKTKERELKNNEEKIYETCGSQRFDEGLSLLQQKMSTGQDQRGSLLGANYFFRKYVTDLNKDDPCCPLCHREFDTTQEVRELILELENKLRLVPGKLEQSERDLTEHQSKYDAMQQLKPLKEHITSLEDNLIPELKTKIADTTGRIDELKQSIQEKSDGLALQKSDESTATSIKPDIIMMDRNLGEIRDLDKKIRSQSAKLIGGDSNRTLEAVNEEKEDAQLTLETVNHQLDHKRDKLRNHGERIQTLKDQLNELTSERLTIEKYLQERVKLEETKTALVKENESLDIDIKEITEDLIPLQGEIQSLDSDKRQIISEKERNMDAAKLKVDAVHKKFSDIDAYHKKNLRYVSDGKVAQLESSRSRQSHIQREAETMTAEFQEVATDLDKLRKDLSTQQIHERELEDNQKLREKGADVIKLEARIARVKDDIGGLDPVGLEREKQGLENKKDELKNQYMKAEGRQKGYEDEMKRLRTELATDQYSGAGDKYRDKMITLKTTEMATSDLIKYHKVLDRAIMDYHSLKMSEINKIIRDLWRKTYKGNDIETIEIRSDEDEDGLNKTRRVYHYRVVMIKGDVEMDMRGRCSAGQKVLASLIIRMALAETFCLNCGILALDEPTTNLDRENIESLAYALVEIIKSRQSQLNFRLIVITHDEDFVELLGRSDYVEEFFKIRKNNLGCSQIVRARVADLHMR